MWNSAHELYLESRILSADPIELIRLLYQGATASVREAREHLAAGEIMERASAITKASAILLELSTALDHTQGGEISERLAALYAYMIQRLTEANMRQADEPLVEVLGLLTTLAEGWEGVKAAVAPAEPVPAQQPSPWAQPEAAEPVGAGAHQAWSF